MQQKTVFLILLLFLLSGCAYLNYLRDPFVDIPVFGKVTDTIYRGGYPKRGAYRKLKDLGIKTIVNLSPVKDKRFQYEQEIAAQYGFTVVHIPLSVYTWPEDEKVLLFLKTVLDPDKQPVYVHCTTGRDLTGTMVAVYRTIVEKKGPKEGYKEALRYGFWPYKGDVVLKKYIHQLKDRKVLYDFVKEYTQQTK
jgi:protein tyrosine/serine phosphatase